MLDQFLQKTKIDIITVHPIPIIVTSRTTATIITANIEVDMVAADGDDGTKGTFVPVVVTVSTTHKKNMTVLYNFHKLPNILVHTYGDRLTS